MGQQINIQAPAMGGQVVAPLSAGEEFENFVYLLSHDLRNSVRALLEVPRWIEEDLKADGYVISGSVGENLGLLNVHTRRLDRMLIDLLVYSRVGRKQSTRDVDLKDAIDQVLDQVALPRGFEVICDIGCSKLPVGERDILTLLCALISNAVKHHHREEGVIRISSRRDGDHCVICVCDDGPGIPPKYRDRVFEAMTTLKSRDEVEGSGMGLPTVRKIIEFNGGHHSWLMGDGDSGTALQMWFPLAPGSSPDATEARKTA